MIFSFDLYFDFRFDLDCALTGQMGFQTDFSFDYVCILNDSFDSGDYFPLVSGSSTNLVFNLIYANVFSNTNCESNESYKCAALALSRIRCWIISITAAASGNACKSVYNPFCIKKQRSKKSVSKTPCASVKIRERFFDLRSVAAGSQDELQQGFSLLVYFL